MFGWIRWTARATFLIFLATQVARADAPPEEATDSQEDAASTEEVLPAVTPLDEIVVTASRYSILRDDPSSGVELGREDILALPHLFDDLYRAVTVLPGTASNDISGRFSVRGSLHREVLVDLDGIELYEPFHLKDFQGVFTIFDPEILGSLDLVTGGFTAEYGDRMSGVIDMATVMPNTKRHGASISFTTAQASSAGTFSEGRGTWLASARRGYLDIVLNFVDGDNDFSPQYWDTFGKLTWELGASSNLAANLLFADDDLEIDDTDDPNDIETASTRYGSSYLWLRHQAVLGDTTSVLSTVSASRVDGDRQAFFVDLGDRFDLVDDRALEVFALKQHWSRQPSTRHYLQGGFDVRALEADYDYWNDRVVDPVLTALRSLPPSGVTTFTGRFTGEHYTAWASDRLRLGDDLTLEVGARYDEQTLTDDSQFSPRLNLVYALGSAGNLRASWGRFYQSQRPYELQVEDGETDFFRAERAEHRLIGWQRSLGERLSLSVDAYEREVMNPRPRYDTLFDPFSPFPEIEPDRVLLEAESTTAQGIEIFLRRQGGARFNWWIHYALSSVEDEINGRSVPRPFDQEHALVIDLNLRLRQWNLNMAWRYHTGWPTTEIFALLNERPNGTFGLEELVVGPFYDERLPDYHRLDLRASRSWPMRHGQLKFFVEIQNLYNRENVRGFDVEGYHLGSPAADGTPRAFPNEEEWLGMIPSFGIGWDF